METLSPSSTHPYDPFVGFGPQPVSCRWLSQEDENAAQSAEIIRLVVDEERGHCGPWANDVYQRHFLRDVHRFIGPTDAVLVTDAGSIKAYIPPLDTSMSSLSSGLGALERVLSPIDILQREVLIGLDGCIAGQTTHLQTVVHLKGRREATLSNTTVKLYPAGDERKSLIGWHLCNLVGDVPTVLKPARRVETGVGVVAVLVCNDAAIFSARSRSNLESTLGLAIRKHFAEQILNEPKPTYVLIATHWQGTNPKTGRWSGEAFLQAADYLNQEFGVTVVTTMRSPRHEVELAAARFLNVGPKRDKIATLLVYDTPVS